MLQRLRERAQGVVAGIIVGVLVLAFSMWGIQNYLTTSAGREIAAKVNGEKITAQQLNNAFERTRRRMMVQFSGMINLNQAQQAKLKQTVLQQLINSEVRAQAAKKQGFYISTQQVQAVIGQMSAFQEGGQFSPARFQQVIDNMLYTPQSFATELERSMLAQQVQQGIMSSAFSLPSEIDQTVQLMDQTRDVSYFTITAKQFANKVSASDAAIQAYYKKHVAQFKTPEEISINYIELSPTKIKKSIHPTPTELQTFYQDHIDQFSKSEQWKVSRILFQLPENPSPADVKAAQTKAQDVLAKLKSGESFAKLATTYSDDKVTGLVGGALKWFSHSGQPAVFVQIVSSMKKGEVSAPFQTSDGINIVKLQAVKKADIIPFIQVSKEVTKKYERQAMEKEFSKLSDQISELTYTNPDTLKPAAKALDVKIQSTGFFSRQGGKQGISAITRVVNTAFNEDVLTQRNNSNPIQLKDGTILVLRINEHKPAAVKPLTAVREQIIKAIKQQEIQKAAAQTGDKLIAKLEQGELLSKLSSEYTWTTRDSATRQAEGINAQIIRAAFSAPIPQSAKQPSIVGVSLPSGDYAVIKVADVRNGDITKVKGQQRKVIQTQIENNMGRLAFILYSKYITAKAKIENELVK